MTASTSLCAVTHTLTWPPQKPPSPTACRVPTGEVGKRCPQHTRYQAAGLGEALPSGGSKEGYQEEGPWRHNPQSGCSSPTAVLQCSPGSGLSVPAADPDSVTGEPG